MQPALFQPVEARPSQLGQRPLLTGSSSRRNWRTSGRCARRTRNWYSGGTDARRRIRIAMITPSPPTCGPPGWRSRTAGSAAAAAGRCGRSARPRVRARARCSRSTGRCPCAGTSPARRGWRAACIEQLRTDQRRVQAGLRATSVAVGAIMRMLAGGGRRGRPRRAASSRRSGRDSGASRPRPAGSRTA